MTKATRVLPAELVRLVWHYDPDTGDLTWKIPTSGRERSTSTLGRPRKHGSSARAVGLGGINYHAHVIIWIWMTGAPPDGEVDHKDRDPSNNRWNNLRLATRGQNQANTGLYRNNKAGVRGVHYIQAMRRWRAMISENGKNRHLGYFNTPEDANSAWAKEAARLHGEFAAVRC